MSDPNLCFNVMASRRNGRSGKASLPAAEIIAADSLAVLRKIEARGVSTRRTTQGRSPVSVQYEHRLGPWGDGLGVGGGRRQVALLDLDRAWFELIRFKNERGWHIFNIPRTAVDALLADSDWYHLLIPALMLSLDDMGKIAVWQEIAETLLKQYAEPYYRFRKKGWEEPHLEYAELSADDPNFPEAGVGVGEEQGVYRVSVEKSEETLITQLKQLGDELRRRVAVADQRLHGGQAAVEVV